MTKYIFSDEYEMNVVGDKCIIFSQDCKRIFEANAIEKMIIDHFKTQCVVDNVEKMCSNIPGFNRDEFFCFIEELIKTGIVVEYRP